MDKIFADYIEYYKARMQRWEDNNYYPNVYAAEKALYELVAACSSMEELQSKAEVFKALSVKNAIALVKDQSAFRKKIYDECEETIRAKAPAEILAQVATVQTDMELVETVNKVQQKNSVEITVDELINMFAADLVAMENIEVYQQAQVPEEWKADIKKYEQEIFDGNKAVWQKEQLPAARHWQADWVMDYGLLKQARHRRLIPINDTELDKKIALHKTLKPA